MTLDKEIKETFVHVYHMIRDAEDLLTDIMQTVDELEHNLSLKVKSKDGKGIY